MTPSPDTKGAQPEQLVEAIEALRPVCLDPKGLDIALEEAQCLATALSECRERERMLRDWLAMAPTPRGIGIPPPPVYAGWYERSRVALAAQPTSEASERSGNA